MQRLHVVIVGLAFVISARSANCGEVAVSVDNDGGVHYSLDGREVTTYDTRDKWAKPFFWPLRTPNGVSVTRDWPIERTNSITRDHVHQKSAWLTYGEVTPIDDSTGDKSRSIDFWAEAPGHGVIAVTQRQSPSQGEPLQTTNEWRSASGKPVLLEKRSIQVVPAAAGYLIVIESDFVAKFGPVEFGDTKEGALGVRVHDLLCVAEKGWFNPQSRITNADGKIGEKTCWGLTSNWCDYSGKINGKLVGIAIFDDPSNKYRSCWHVRDYGLMAANPFGRERSGFPAMRGRTDLVRLAKGEHLKLRYALYVHDGDVESGKVAEAYEQFLKLKK